MLIWCSIQYVILCSCIRFGILPAEFPAALMAKAGVQLISLNLLELEFQHALSLRNYIVKSEQPHWSHSIFKLILDEVRLLRLFLHLVCIYLTFVFSVQAGQ